MNTDIKKITVAGVELDLCSPYGKALQAARDEGGFHWKDDIFFKRLSDGSVRVRYFAQHINSNYLPQFYDWVIPPAEWASIVCSVSTHGETLERWIDAQDFHGREQNNETLD